MAHTPSRIDVTLDVNYQRGHRAITAELADATPSVLTLARRLAHERQRQVTHGTPAYWQIAGALAAINELLGDDPR